MLPNNTTLLWVFLHPDHPDLALHNFWPFADTFVELQRITHVIINYQEANR